MDTQVADNGAYVGTGGSAGPAGAVIGPSDGHKPDSHGPRRWGSRPTAAHRCEDRALDAFTLKLCSA